MTFAQLTYVVEVAQAGTISKAAERLFLSQPSLTAAIKDLEQEFGISIFKRTNKGVLLTPEGEEFLSYARQILSQTRLLEERYSSELTQRHQFCVSTQHYSFAVDAFVELLTAYGGEEYDFRIRETQTYEIIEDVAKLKSEVGILYLNDFNETVLRKAFREHNLHFSPLFIAKPHVFVGIDNPLARKKSVTLQDLQPFPRLSYEQGEHNAFYFSEEILSTLESKKDIMVCDRATLFNLLIGLNGYTICSGVINEKLNGKNIVAIPLDVNESIQIGYVTHNKVALGRFAALYLERLHQYAQVHHASTAFPYHRSSHR
ncbi:MAG: LysR family transcriptional regulator [Candidatus Fournierella pullistercoris]|uniref:LysR family transcriptional regulator n=1 Tax=Candidatus Allofournierella pullistercoris TaxID=2838597 RepID=A0A948T2S9_9FIRM|nr:LysR family transcriptional regulator [Candidatus Fournierella pullistercoris]